MSYDNTKNDVKQLVEKIELLAKEVHSRLSTGGDYLTLASELVTKSNTFVFALGEMCALEQLGSGKKTKVKVVRVPNPNAPKRSYKRDSSGRFARV